MTTFHSLTVAKVEPETRDAVTITFAIPDALRNAYAFRPGQHLTLKTRLGGEELRRCYSICRSRTPGKSAWRSRPSTADASHAMPRTTFNKGWRWR